MTVPEFQPGDFLLFGSFFALDPAVRISLKKLVLEARNQGALILYDPNFRSNHLSNLPALLPSFYENLSLAHLVRGSHEDFGFLLGTQDPWEIDAKLSDAGSTHQIVTTGAGPVHLFCNGMHISVPPAPVTPVSTIGAGDTFNAGVLYGLHARNAQAGTLHSFPSCEWSEILTLASTLAANTCSSYENYISEGLATQINEYI